MTTLLITGTYSFASVIAIAIAAACAGYLMKMTKIAVAKKRILKLEDEMLANHARILKLQKKLTELEAENKNQDDATNAGNIKKMDDLKRRIS